MSVGGMYGNKNRNSIQVHDLDLLTTEIKILFLKLTILLNLNFNAKESLDQN